MDKSSNDYTPQLQHLMQLVGLTSFKALCQQAGVSRQQVAQLRKGQIKQVKLEKLLRLSQVLQTPLVDLLTVFSEQAIEPELISQVRSPKSDLTDTHFQTLQQEYQHLEKQLVEQRQVLWQEFQQATLQTLESFLLQWPTAAYAAQQNPQAPAVRLLPLVRPVEQLLQEWGIAAIAAVGITVPYDPQFHQLMEGTAQLGDPVRIRYTGYCQGDKLLYRAKVSPSRAV
jgi:transcriptional regulator with XRE-family HTH domain